MLPATSGWMFEYSDQYSSTELHSGGADRDNRMPLLPMM